MRDIIIRWMADGMRPENAGPAQTLYDLYVNARNELLTLEDQRPYIDLNNYLSKASVTFSNIEFIPEWLAFADAYPVIEAIGGDYGNGNLKKKLLEYVNLVDVTRDFRQS
jgi:hypothetical protein